MIRMMKEWRNVELKGNSRKKFSSLFQVLKLTFILVVMIIVFYRNTELVVNAATINDELVYKSNGKFISLNTLGNNTYANINRKSDIYLKISIDNEVIQGSVVKLYVLNGSNESGVYATSTFNCRYKDSDYYWENYYAYIPISSAIKYQQGSIRLYYDMTLANGQVFRTTDLGSINAFYINLLGDYTVAYNANGGTGAPDSQTKYSESRLILSSVIPTRGGYTFKGWSTSSLATSAIYQPGDSYALNSSITLYAVWEANTYSVYYDANGGIGAPQTQTKIHGQTLTLSDIKPTREGYVFMGWSTTTGVYQPGAKYTSNNETTLHAVWKKIEDDKTDINNNSNIANDIENSNLFSKKQQIISAKSFVVAKGTKPFSINAKTNGNGNMTYISSNKKIVSISSTGRISIKGYGKVTITINVSETSQYVGATKTITIKVVPKIMSLKTVKSLGKKKMSATWKKDKTATGYQVQFCTRKDFKHGTFQRVFNKSKMMMKIYGVKSGKVYYVRIRAFKEKSKAKYYGAWSKIKSVKVK